MKKLISILLLVCISVLGLTACTSSNPPSQSNNPPSQSSNPPAKSCTDTGIHTYDKGECTGCGLKVFDVVKDYLKKNGEKVNSTTNQIALGSFNGDEYYCYVGYDASDDRIFLSACYQSHPNAQTLNHRFDIRLDFTPYTFEDDECDWVAYCFGIGCSHPKISGKLVLSKFSRSTSSLSYSSNASGADDMASTALRALKNNMNDYYVDFFNSVGKNISIQDFGFARYNKIQIIE